MLVLAMMTYLPAKYGAIKPCFEGVKPTLLVRPATELHA